MAQSKSQLTIVGDPTTGSSMPRFAREIAVLANQWADVVFSATPPDSGPMFLALDDRQERAAAIKATDPERLVTLVHPSAWVSDQAVVGRNVLINALAVVMLDAIIGDGVVVSSNCSVEHDNRLGDMTFLGTGVSLCGYVTTGAFAFIGGGAVIQPGRTIGAGATVGTGAVVVRDVEPDQTVVGNPAKPL